jgi:hypothetical protein
MDQFVTDADLARDLRELPATSRRMLTKAIAEAGRQLPENHALRPALVPLVDASDLAVCADDAILANVSRALEAWAEPYATDPSDGPYDSFLVDLSMAWIGRDRTDEDHEDEMWDGFEASRDAAELC